MKHFKRMMSCLLIGVLLLSVLPAAAAAPVDNENVLISIAHLEAGMATLEGNNRAVTLTFPYLKPAGFKVDLTTGLNIDFNKTVYKSVVATPSQLSAGEGETAQLVVTYNHVSDADGAAKCETVYTVRIARAAKAAPVFSGTISREVPGSGIVSFTSNDFIQKYFNNDGGSIGSITINGTNPTFGVLTYNNDNYFKTSPHIPIDTSLLNRDHTIFTFAATSTGTVSFDVKAYEGTDTAQPIGNVVITITSVGAPQLQSPITDTMFKGAVLAFTENYFTSHCDMQGRTFSSVKITPTGSTYGTWNIGTAAYSPGTALNAQQLSTLTFTATAPAAATFPGAATFDWTVTTTGGFDVSGTGTIVITSPTLSLIPYTANTGIFKGGTANISRTHFSFTPVSASLSYIKITALPTATDGSLILTTALPANTTYGYPAIALNATVPVNAVIPAAYINYLTLATKSTSSASQLSFMWTATADMTVSSATWATPSSYTVRFSSVGSLSYTTDMNCPVTLSATNINTNFHYATGSPLSYVTFTIPDKNQGSLFLNYDISKKTGTAVTAAGKYYVDKTPNLSNITFVPGTDYTGSATVSYKGYTLSGGFVSGTIIIAVTNSPGGTLSYTTDKNSAMQFDAKDFQAAFSSATGKPLSYITFSLPSTNYGRLYYNYTLSGDYDSTISPSYPYYVLKPQYLSLVTFVPYTNFTGAVDILFTGYTDSGAAYSGKLRLYVVDSPAGIVSYQVRENGFATLSGADFSKEFISVTGSVFSYMTFTVPAATIGSLYTDYDAQKQTGTKITAATKCFDGKSPDISDITFVPVKNYVGTVIVPYTAYTVNGVPYAGKLRFTVSEGSNVITYNAESGKPLTLNSSDFFNAFFINSAGKSLSYITFDIPSSSYGTLYYNYTSSTKYDAVVSTDKKYYSASSPYISTVAFVPQDTYTGSFSISYTGYTASGESYAGKIKITVSSTNNGAVNYTTNASTPVTFNTSDFITAFSGKSIYSLNYVRFTLPYDSYGTLYYGYTPTSSYNTLVSSATNYYVSSLSAVTFVPNQNYSGSLAINYIAFDTAGNAYNGTVYITVKSNDIGTITFGTNINMPFVFNADSLNTAFVNKTGSALYAMSFTLPAASYGKLYLCYSTSTSTAVYAGTRYYRSFSPLLSDITFVPAAGYYGTVTISYTAYTAGGAAYYGKILINVGTSVPFTDIDADYPWAKDAITYLYRNGIISDSGSGKYNPGNNMTRGDFTMMIARAFNLADSSSDNFPDVPPESPNHDAIAAAKAVGIIYGSSDGKFYPDTGLTRQDAMVIILRALEYVGAPISKGSKSDLTGYADAAQVSDYAVSAVATLVKTGLVGGYDGNLSPKSMISRAETSVILHRILTM